MKIFNFFIQYMDHIHTKYIDFSSIYFFHFNNSMTYHSRSVLIILISVKMLYKDFNVFIEMIFLLKRKKN